MKDIIIVDEEKFEGLKQRFKEGGSDRIHVLADFDRTLTKAFVKGNRSPTVIAQIRNGKYLTENYPKDAHALFDYYHPIEIDTSISQDEKNKLMKEWWKKHFDLLIESGMNKEVIRDIVSKKNLVLRGGVLKFIDDLNSLDIPLVIMSAGPGDMIIEHLGGEDKLYDNIHIIANLFKFNNEGIAIGIEEPIIHSMNKHEIEVKDSPFYEELLKRKNVILLGDNLEDVGMIEGFEYDNLIKIGFLNENVDENLERYKKVYDVIILNDGDFEFVNRLISEVH